MIQKMTDPQKLMNVIHQLNAYTHLQSDDVATESDECCEEEVCDDFHKLRTLCVETRPPTSRRKCSGPGITKEHLARYLCQNV